MFPNYQRVMRSKIRTDSHQPEINAFVTATRHRRDDLRPIAVKS
jgi:hypothetical protein